MKQTLYILHGWAIRTGEGNKDKWQPFISELESLGVTTKFLQIPGLSVPLAEVWNLDDFVTWLETQLPKKEKVVLLGHSFGGQIATRFTAEHPDRVAKLILLDSAGIRDNALKQKIKRFVFLIAAKLGKFLFRAEIFRKLLYKLARERDYQNAPPLLRRTMSNVLDAQTLTDMPKISCETHIVWGDHDMTTPVKHAYQMQQLIKNSQLHFIENARHSPQFTHVKETANVIGAILK